MSFFQDWEEEGRRVSCMQKYTGLSKMVSFMFVIYTYELTTLEPAPN